LIKAFVPAGAPVVIGFDDTIERRWGPKIGARGKHYAIEAECLVSFHGDCSAAAAGQSYREWRP
jgi:hypothetical protein